MNFGDQGIYATFISNKFLDIFPDNTSSSFKSLLPRPIKLDFDSPYYIGVCSISYADTYRPKAPKELQTTTPKAIPEGRTTFFGQSSGDNRMRVSELVEVVWNWPKSEEDFTEFYTSFLNNANDKLGKGVVVVSEFPTVVENDGYPKPITELRFTDEEAVWTISLSNELAAVLGFEQTEFKPGTFRSNPFNASYYKTIGMNTIFRARVYKWIDHIIDVPEPLVYDFDDLCQEIAALVVLKGFDLTLSILSDDLVNDFVRVQFDYSEKHFKINFPPVFHNLLGLPLDYEFEGTKEYFIYGEIDISNSTDPPPTNNEQIQVLNAATSDLIHIRCSVAESCIFGNTTIPIIRTFPRPAGTNTPNNVNFDSVYYHKLNCSDISLVQFDLLNSELAPIKPSTYPTLIICNIRKHLL
jgi:hypothetical protein